MHVFTQLFMLLHLSLLYSCGVLRGVTCTVKSNVYFSQRATLGGRAAGLLGWRLRRARPPTLFGAALGTAALTGDTAR